MQKKKSFEYILQYNVPVIDSHNATHFISMSMLLFCWPTARPLTLNILHAADNKPIAPMCVGQGEMSVWIESHRSEPFPKHVPFSFIAWRNGNNAPPPFLNMVF